MSAKILFNCSTLVFDLFYRIILFKKTLTFISYFLRLNNLLSIEIYARYYKGPFLP